MPSPQSTNNTFSTHSHEWSQPNENSIITWDSCPFSLWNSAPHRAGLAESQWRPHQYSICFKRFCFCILHFLPDLPARCGIEAEYWISSSLKLSGAHHIFSIIKRIRAKKDPVLRNPWKSNNKSKKSRQFCNIYSFFIQSDTKTYLKKHNNSG